MWLFALVSGVAIRLTFKELPSLSYDPEFAAQTGGPRRSLLLALFVTSLTWVIVAAMLAARAARGLVLRFDVPDLYLLLDAVFLVFLVSVGFSMLQFVVARNTPFRETIGLPVRASAKTEWTTGVAIGWGAILLSVLPVALAGDLHARLWVEPRALWLLVIHLAAAGVLTLASEIALFGYPYRRLIEAIGSSWATVVMALLFAMAGSFTQFGGGGTRTSNLTAVLLGLLLCSAWLRTRGLWLGWGLHFAWIASLGILFGFPVSGIETLASVVQTRAIGAEWLTGGDLGLEGAMFTVIALGAAIAVLVRASRDWSWEYNHRPIVSGGYPMDVAPPAAHTAMEQAAVAKPPALVQILPTTPQTRSVSDEVR